MPLQYQGYCSPFTSVRTTEDFYHLLKLLCEPLSSSYRQFLSHHCAWVPAAGRVSPRSGYFLPSYWGGNRAAWGRGAWLGAQEILGRLAENKRAHAGMQNGSWGHMLSLTFPLNKPGLSPHRGHTTLSYQLWALHSQVHPAGASPSLSLQETPICLSKPSSEPRLLLPSNREPRSERPAGEPGPLLLALLQTVRLCGDADPVV